MGGLSRHRVILGFLALWLVVSSEFSNEKKIDSPMFMSRYPVYAFYTYNSPSLATF